MIALAALSVGATTPTETTVTSGRPSGTAGLLMVPPHANRQPASERGLGHLVRRDLSERSPAEPRSLDANLQQLRVKLQNLGHVRRIDAQLQNCGRAELVQGLDGTARAFPGPQPHRVELVVVVHRAR